MSLFGDKSLLAVEFELDKDHCGAWLFGRFCYWVAGQQVGNYPEGTSLRDVLFELEPIIRDAGKRQHEEFSLLPPSQVFRRLYAALYGPTESPDDQRALEETWARFRINPEVDIFDGWLVFLVDGVSGERIMWGAPALDAAVHETTLPRGLFDGLLRRAYDELAAAYDRELAVTNRQD